MLFNYFSVNIVYIGYMQRFVHQMQWVFIRVNKKISSFFSLLYLKSSGVIVGKNCTFYGWPYISIAPQSEFVIGDNCCFVSNQTVNYRGVNHKCIFQTGKCGAKIRIGNDCGFSGVSIVSDCSVIIGDKVTVGTNVIIGDRDDHADLYPSRPMPIVINNNVWIGMNCIILKGVTIGENTIIGAGSIVTKSIPSNVIAAGNPCKIIKYK